MPKARAAWLLALLLTLAARPAAAQSGGVLSRARVVDGDTVAVVRLGEVRVFGRFRSKRQQQRWTRYIYNVKRALPYARLLAQELRAINDSLAAMTTEREREEFLDRKETELFRRYENPLKHLTVSQGRILIKLVDRETGSTSYELIRLLKGRFKAFWWQGIAHLFGSNLKAEFDPEGEDKYLETVVTLIDQGYY